MIVNSQCGLSRGGSCLTNLIAFYNTTTGFVYKESAAGGVYLYISKAFETVFHSILVSGCRYIMVWMGEHRLNGWTLGVVVMGQTLPVVADPASSRRLH